MANLICSLNGVRGRSIKVYDNKCIIRTDVTIGSVITHNATDGTKVIFYKDCTGIQFKESSMTIGYLQVETPSMQMNNQASNFFSENTFTFDTNAADSVDNATMREVFTYIVNRVEGYKYDDEALLMADLPPKLAKLYGKPRPLTKEEIAQERAAAAAKQKQIEEEKARERQLALQKLEERKQAGDNAFEVFMFSAKECSNVAQILELWEADPPVGGSLGDKMHQKLKDTVLTERMYGVNERTKTRLLEVLEYQLTH